MNKAKNMISNYESNVQLLNECFSNNSIKVILNSVYEKEIDSDIIDIVFYSTLFNVRLEGFYLNITRSHNYIDLVKEFSKVNIIPIFRDSTYKEKTEYIGFCIKSRRFKRIAFKKVDEECTIIELFNRNVYLSDLKSSCVENYLSLEKIKEKCELLMENAKDFIKNNKSFQKFLKKTKRAKHNHKKYSPLRLFARIKFMKLTFELHLFLQQNNLNELFDSEAEKFVEFLFMDWLEILLGIEI